MSSPPSWSAICGTAVAPDARRRAAGTLAAVALLAACNAAPPSAAPTPPAAPAETTAPPAETPEPADATAPPSVATETAAPTAPATDAAATQPPRKKPRTRQRQRSEVPTASAPALDDVAVRLAEVATLDAPTALAVRRGDDAVYIAERGGRIRVLRRGAVAPKPLLDISGDTTVDGERGLLGIAFSAAGDELYVSYTDPAGDSRLAAYRMDGDAVDLRSRRELLRVEQPFANHNGGNIAVGPDRLLYLGLGDGGSAGDPQGNGQDLGTLLGALLRIDPRGDPYRIPRDNPFVDRAGARPEIFVYGLRNPWRFSFDRATGDLWIGDVGQGEIEEIDVLPAGKAAGRNLGWDLFEGTRPFEPAGDPPDDLVAPVAEYGHSDGRCSVTGGYVYRGEAIPALRGAYVYGDFCGGQIVALAQRGGTLGDQADLGITVEQLVSFGEDRDGELYVLSLAGPVYKLVPA